MPTNLPDEAKSLHAKGAALANQRLEDIKRPLLTTQEAAHFLNRKPATLLFWATTGEGPIEPVRAPKTTKPRGRVMGWRTSDIKALLGMPV